MSTLAKLIVQIGANTAEFETNLKKVQSQLKTLAKDFTKAGEQFTAVGKTLTTSFTLPIVALGTAAGKTFMDFELTMSRITGLVGINKDQVADWGDAILKMGPALGKSPKELAEALYFITSSGVDTSKALGVLEVSAKAASAGLGSTAVIADAVTSAMNAYQSTGMTAAHATDILTAAVKYGKMEADQLAPSLGMVISVASSLGIGFDQVAGSMAAMSLTGVDASESATALGAIMSMLMKPTAGSTKLLEEHGLSMKQLRDMAGQPGGLIEVLRLLDTTFGQNDEELTTIIPNVRALRGVMNLLAQDSGTVDKVLQGVTNSTGATDAAFKAYSATSRADLDTSIKQLMSSLVVVGQTIMPLVTGAAQDGTAALKEFSSWWTGLTEEQRRWIVNTALVVAAVGPVLLAIGGVLKMIGTLTTVIKGVGTALAWLAANPVGAVIVGMVALTAGIVWLAKNWGELWNDMKNSSNPIIKTMVSIIEGITWAITHVIEGIKDAINWLAKMNSNAGVNQGGVYAPAPVASVPTKAPTSIKTLTPVKAPAGISAATAAKNLAAAKALASQSLRGHALGGYFTTPHIAQIAEAGPEWVVPQSQAASFANQMGGSDMAAQQRQMMLKMDAILSAIGRVAPGVGSVINGLGRA